MSEPRRIQTVAEIHAEGDKWAMENVAAGAFWNAANGAEARSYASAAYRAGVAAERARVRAEIERLRDERGNAMSWPEDNDEHGFAEELLAWLDAEQKEEKE
jgi:hypothetical protein